MRRQPPQVWLLFAGDLLGSLGQGLVWPFLTINIREQLDVSLSTITLLFTVQSIAGFVATTLLSPFIDRIGRKWPMVAGLVGSSMVLLGMSRAAALWPWAVLLALYAVFNMLFRISGHAMVADLVGSEQRAETYALLRMGDNIGIALGPTIGGFLVTWTYRLSYYLAAVVQIALAWGVTALMSETLPQVSVEQQSRAASSMGYGPLLRDRPFLGLLASYILVQVANAMVFVLLGLYVKENFAIAENRYGFIVGTNAAMVVFFQYAVTRQTDHYAPLPVIALAALLYAAGMVGFALSRSFPAFLLAMVITTVGELMLVPTATALVSNIAPADMRARYMGVFSLSFRIGAGIGPVVGGLLNDQVAPVAIWYGALASCLAAAAGFGVLVRYRFAVPDTVRSLG